MEIYNSTFEQNKASKEGGAVKWNMIRPKIDSKSVFKENKADFYGNDIASYGTKVVKLTLDEYKESQQKL